MKSRYLQLFAVSITAQSTTTAATWTWNGNTSGGWGVNTNWVGSVTPTFDNTADLVFGATPIVNHLTFLGNGPRTVRSISGTGAGVTSPLEIRTSDNGTVGRILNFSADAGTASVMIDASVNQTVNIGASTVGSVNLVSDLSISHDGSGLLTISRPVTESSAGRSITKSGAGTLLLSAANTFTGTVTVNNGILRISNAAALGATAGGTVVNAGGTLDLNGIKLGAAEPVSIAGTGHGGIGALYQTTGNTGDANTFPAGLVLTGNVSVGGATGTRFGVGGNAPTLSTSGPFTFTKVGAGQFDLRGAVSVGDIIVNEGILQTQGGGSYNAGTITVNPGAEFRIFECTGTFARDFILNSGRLASTGSVDFTGDTISSNVTLNGACVIQSTGGINDRFILTGEISESTAGSSVTIGGDRRVVFAGTNTYTGPTNLNLGTLQAEGTFTSDINVASGATLDGEGETTGSVTFANNSNLTFNPATIGENEFLRAADIIVNPGDLVAVRPSAAGTSSNAVVLRDGNGGLDLANFVLSEPGRATLGLGGEGGDSDLIYSLNAANLEWRGFDDGYWATEDSVATNFQNLDSSTADDFYSYDNVDFTDVATGSVVLFDNITAGDVVFKNTTGNDVELNGGVTLSSTGIETTSSGNVIINPTIIGSTPITVGGTGALILTGNNTSLGAITVDSGTLQLGNGGSTGSVATDIINNGNVTFNRSTNLTTNSVISGSGTLTQAGTAATILTAENTYTGLTTIVSGTLEIGAGPTGSIVGDILNDSALIINRTNAYTHAGNISGTGTLRKNSVGEVILTGTNTFSGDLTINNGTITGADSALGTGTIQMGANTVNAVTLNLANGTTVDNPIVFTDIGGNKILDVVDGAGNTATISGPITINTNTIDAVRLGIDPGEP
jgi:fibronectin-binding autotransporter adhesin